MTQNHTRSDLRRPEIQKFPGGACPQTPLACALRADIRLPRTVLSSQFPRRTSANELPSPLLSMYIPTFSTRWTWMMHGIEGEHEQAECSSAVQYFNRCPLQCKVYSFSRAVCSAALTSLKSLNVRSSPA